MRDDLSLHTMDKSTFKPGFYFTASDVVVLVVGLVVSIIIGSKIWQGGLIVAFVVSHFFLFCNVFRISRSSELMWAAGFVLITASTILTQYPGWSATVIGGLVLSSLLIWKETKKEGYHGIYWQNWNPDLPDWWELQQNPSKDEAGTIGHLDSPEE